MTKRCACPAPHVRIEKGKFYCLDCGLRVSAANKYGAERASCGKHVHDSKREAARCGELQQMERGGLIGALEFHPVYELRVGEVLICKYEADWRYLERLREKRIGADLAAAWSDPIVEDLKGKRTEGYRLKRKLMLALYAIPIKETA